MGMPSGTASIRNRPRVAAAKVWSFTASARNSANSIADTVADVAPSRYGLRSSTSGCVFPADISHTVEPGGTGPGVRRNVCVRYPASPWYSVHGSPFTVTSIGTVLATRSVTLRNELPGTVQEVLLPPGQIVEAGTVLVRLDVSVEQAEMEAHRAEVTLAQALLDRSQKASENGAVSDVEVDRARAERDVALAGMDRIQAPPGIDLHDRRRSAAGQRAGGRDVGDEHDLADGLGAGAGDSEGDLSSRGGVDRAAQPEVFEGEGHGHAGQDGRRQGGERDPKLGGGRCHTFTA